MVRIKVSVTWWASPGSEVRQIAVETYSEDGTRLGCRTFEAQDGDGVLVHHATALAGACLGLLPF